MPEAREPKPPEEVAVIAPWLNQLNKRGENAIDLLWAQYQAGDFPVAASHNESHLQMIPQNDLLTIATRDENRVEDLQVQNFAASNLIGNNFMGFTPRNHCFAFRGEKRHLKTFLDYAYSFIEDNRVEDKSIEAVYKPASEVKFPETGVARELDYQNFAQRVEIVEYAIWLKQEQVKPIKDLTADESTMTILSVVKDGREIVVEPSEYTYDADISYSHGSEESHLSSVTMTVEQSIHRERSVHAPEQRLNVPRISVEPPSSHGTETEYRRPKSWSPLTEPDGGTEEIEHLAMPLTEPTLAEAETPGEVKVNNDILGLSFGIDAEDEVMTDGSLFGGSIGELENLNQRETDGNLQLPDAMNLNNLEVPTLDSTVIENVENLNPSGRRDSGLLTVVPHEDFSAKMDQSAQQTVALPTEPNIDVSKDAQTPATKVPDAQVDQVGVNVPVPCGQPDDAYQPAVRTVQGALQSATPTYGPGPEQNMSLVSPIPPSEDGTDPLALSDGENTMSTNQRPSYHQSYWDDAALASQLAEAEARSRYPMRKRSSTQEAETPSPRKKPALKQPPLRKTTTSSLTAKAATPKAACSKVATPKKTSAKKKDKVFREGTRKNPRRDAGTGAVNYAA